MAKLADEWGNRLLARMSPVWSPPRLLVTMGDTASPSDLRLQLAPTQAWRWSVELDRWVRRAAQVVAAVETEALATGRSPARASVVDWPRCLPAISPLRADGGATLATATTAGQLPGLWIAAHRPILTWSDGEKTPEYARLIADADQVRCLRDGLADWCDRLDELIGTGLIAAQDDANPNAGEVSR